MGNDFLTEEIAYGKIGKQQKQFSTRLFIMTK